MKAVVIDEYGSNDVVRYTDIDTPEPKAGEVLIKVAAAGVNPVDWKIRSGAGQRMGMSLPIHLGGEISGVVAAVGQGVQSLSPGDAIYGIIPSGAFAEYAVAKAADLTRKPANLDFIQAAAIPLGGLTAWQAMFDIAGLASGQRLLITNASGGVGSLAVQMARAKGVHVTAIASRRNEEFVRSLGADDFIDYTTQLFERAASDMDVVFDTVGGDAFERAFLTVKKGGFVVTSVAFPTDEAKRLGVGVARVQCKPDAGELALMRAMVEEGKLAAHIARVLPLAHIKEALALSEAGHTRGKIVLQIAE